MKKIVMYLFVLSKISCIATDIAVSQNAEINNNMRSEEYKKLGMEINPLTGRYNIKIKGVSTSLTHHIQRYIQDPDKYSFAYPNSGTYNLLKVYDATANANYKKINSEADIDNIQKFSDALASNTLSYWVSIRDSRDHIKNLNNTHILWHVIVGLKSSNAQDMYYAQKILRRTDELRISDVEVEEDHKENQN